MAKIHHFKIKNKGKRGHIHDIGNINIRLNVGQQCSTKSSCSERECRNCDRLDESHPQQLQQADEYEEGVSSESAGETETESESETDTDGQLTAINESAVGNVLVYTGKLINSLTSTGKATKDRKVIKKEMKRNCKKHKLKNSLQNKLIEFVKKDKPKSKLTSIFKNSSKLMVYALGSYCEGTVEASRGLNIEFNRFSTFHRYKGNGVIASLARDGFYHDHDLSPTSTKCFGCGVSHDTWGPHDDVHSIHRQISPNCEFVRRSSSATDQEVTAMEVVSLRTDVTESGSVTRTGSAVNEAVQTINLAHAHTQEGHREQQEGHREQQEGHREQQEHHREQQEHHREQPTETRVARDNNHQFVESLQREARISTNEGLTQRQEINDMNLEYLTSHSSSHQQTDSEQVSSRNAAAFSPPNVLKHPSYSVLEMRLLSFKNWSHHAPSPRDLAEAGFFCCDNWNLTRCFYCGGGIKNWGTDDNPWEEHFRWFPECDFIKRAREQIRNAGTNTEEHQNQRNKVGQDLMDSVLRQVVESMTSMGFTADVAMKAANAVRFHNTGPWDVLLNEAISWTVEHQQNDRKGEQAQYHAGASFQPSSGAVADACASPSTSNRQDNQRLKSMTLCKICMDNQIAIVFLPCSHMVCCDTCSTSIRRCPSCNVIVNARITPVT